MKLGNIDFNKNLGVLSASNFAKFWKSGKWEEKTGVKGEEAHKKLKAEFEKKSK